MPDHFSGSGLPSPCLQEPCWHPTFAQQLPSSPPPLVSSQVLGSLAVMSLQSPSLRAWDLDTSRNPVMFIYPEPGICGTIWPSLAERVQPDFSLSLRSLTEFGQSFSLHSVPTHLFYYCSYCYHYYFTSNICQCV